MTRSTVNMASTVQRAQMVLVALVALSVVGCAGASGIAKSSNTRGGGTAVHQDSLPPAGLAAYTRAHARNQSPPERLGGPLTVTVVQERGSTRWPLPGPRQLDPAVFGTPEHPLGWESAPFPLVGIPLSMRQENNVHYTIVDHATPFSDWMKAGVGDLRMTVTDRTAIDGATTQDTVDFEATFQSPDKAHDYRVVAKTPLPHGKFFPTFGGGGHRPSHAWLHRDWDKAHAHRVRLCVLLGEGTGLRRRQADQ